MSDEPIPSSDGSAPAGGPNPPADGANCPFCLAPIESADDVTACPSCRAPHHRECWEENQGCAVYGCTHVPVVESRRAIEVPLSYWGQENKPCPSCGQQILAAALRCRHCGATFATARPQESTEFYGQVDLFARLPAARRRVVLLFVLSIIPFTAPIAAVWGLLWRSRNEDTLAALPPLHAAISKIGLIAACAITVGLTLMTVLYVLVGTH